MARKSTRSGRDGRRKLNESQLQAYRARKAATVVEAPPEPVADTKGETRKSERSYRRAVQTGHVTAWGHVGEEYEMIRADLKRLFVITVLMFAIIIVLWFILA
ncbi:MAG TPA: hypothetical protein VHA53_07125 [Nitrolancea sp.]|jgi:hypothetical protein|nr:hypothetical protein [Nitrolancea sp.]